MPLMVLLFGCRIGVVMTMLSYYIGNWTGRVGDWHIRWIRTGGGWRRQTFITLVENFSFDAHTGRTTVRLLLAIYLVGWFFFRFIFLRFWLLLLCYHVVVGRLNGILIVFLVSYKNWWYMILGIYGRALVDLCMRVITQLSDPDLNIASNHSSTTLSWTTELINYQCIEIFFFFFRLPVWQSSLFLSFRKPISLLLFIQFTFFLLCFGFGK